MSSLFRSLIGLDNSADISRDRSFIWAEADSGKLRFAMQKPSGAGMRLTHTDFSNCVTSRSHFFPFAAYISFHVNGYDVEQWKQWGTTKEHAAQMITEKILVADGMACVSNRPSTFLPNSQAACQTPSKNHLLSHLTHLHICEALHNHINLLAPSW